MKTRRITSQYYNFYYRLYKPFLVTYVAGLATNSTEFDEFMSIAREQLMFVLKNFNPDIGAFKSYLRCRVWGFIKHEKDRRAKHRSVFSNGSFDNLGGVEYNQDDRLIVEEMLECLDDKQRMVLSSYYLENMTFREIESATGIPVSTAYVMKNTALQKIRRVHNVEL